MIASCSALLGMRWACVGSSSVSAARIESVKSGDLAFSTWVVGVVGCLAWVPGLGAWRVRGAGSVGWGVVWSRRRPRGGRARQ